MKYKDMNTRQQKAYRNIYYACNWLIGCLENTVDDYAENSKEYKNAYEQLHNHESLVEQLYQMATTDYYDETFVLSDKQANKYMKDIRFCGKDWLMERCEKRICKSGY